MMLACRSYPTSVEVEWGCDNIKLGKLSVSDMQQYVMLDLEEHFSIDYKNIQCNLLNRDMYIGFQLATNFPVFLICTQLSRFLSHYNLNF